jgi:hypothetical protein
MAHGGRRSAAALHRAAGGRSVGGVGGCGGGGGCDCDADVPRSVRRSRGWTEFKLERHPQADSDGRRVHALPPANAHGRPRAARPATHRRPPDPTGPAGRVRAAGAARPRAPPRRRRPPDPLGAGVNPPRHQGRAASPRATTRRAAHRRALRRRSARERVGAAQESRQPSWRTPPYPGERRIGAPSRRARTERGRPRRHSARVTPAHLGPCGPCRLGSPQSPPPTPLRPGSARATPPAPAGYRADGCGPGPSRSGRVASLEPRRLRPPRSDLPCAPAARDLGWTHPLLVPWAGQPGYARGAWSGWGLFGGRAGRAKRRGTSRSDHCAAAPLGEQAHHARPGWAGNTASVVLGDGTVMTTSLPRIVASHASCSFDCKPDSKVGILLVVSRSAEKLNVKSLSGEHKMPLS